MIHHWDADGVAAAALAVRRLGAVCTATPPIGAYNAEALALTTCSAHNTLLVLDYGIPGPQYSVFAAMHRGTVAVVDHHRVEPPSPQPGLSYCNPVAEGRGGEADYPSASFLLYTLLGSPGDSGDKLLAALGAAGDLAPFIDSGVQHPGLRVAERLAAEAGVSLEELRALAERLDSCYRLMDYDCIGYAVALAAKDPWALLSDSRLAEAEKRSASLVAEARARLREVHAEPGLRVYKLVMDAYVTSVVGRALAAEHPADVVVLVHHMPSRGGGYLYARSVSRELGGAIGALRAAGLKAGGKTHVVVVEYDGDPDAALGTLLAALRRQR